MANPAAAPVTFSMNDKEFVMSPLTDRDIQELNNFIKQDILSTAREFCRTETSKMIVEATMKVAMQQVSNIDWIVNSDLLESVERIGYLLWMGIRNNPPKPSRSVFVKELMEDWDKNFELCMSTLQLVNPFLLKKKPPKDKVPGEENEQPQQ